MRRSTPIYMSKKETLWKDPVDLTQDLARRLLHGLAPNHRRRLELFARQGERVSMKELLAVTNDEDLRVLSYFQGALSRKLRRLLGDRDNKVRLIGWDYSVTKWDEAHNQIVDGICYVTPDTVQSLRVCLSSNGIQERCDPAIHATSTEAHEASEVF